MTICLVRVWLPGVLVVAVALISTAGCGHPKTTTSDASTERAADDSGEPDVAVPVDAGDAGTDATGLPTCALDVATGQPCSSANMACAPQRCVACIGGWKLTRFSAIQYSCVCTDNQWFCHDPPTGGASDCLIQRPIKCDQGEMIFEDADCKVPAPCE